MVEAAENEHTPGVGVALGAVGQPGQAGVALTLRFRRPPLQVSLGDAVDGAVDMVEHHILVSIGKDGDLFYRAVRLPCRPTDNLLLWLIGEDGNLTVAE